MARLGKRERNAKRDLIKRNLNSPRESVRQVVRSKSGVLSVIELSTSSTHHDTLLKGSHTMGFRDPQRKLRDQEREGGRWVYK